MLSARYAIGVDRIQFALAGMNAHINHDLSLALLATDQQRNVEPDLASPQHEDYEAVNGLLIRVMQSALQMLRVPAFWGSWRRTRERSAESLLSGISAGRAIWHGSLQIICEGWRVALDRWRLSHKTR